MVSALPPLALLLLGCGNPFSEFYSGKSVTEFQHAGRLVDAPSATPRVIQTTDPEGVFRQWIEDGWVLVGEAGWIGTNVGSEEQAIGQARKVGASIVIWGYQHLGSSTSAMPITTPTVATTYGSGSVYGSGGMASWNGSATTYGTQTTYVPVTMHQFHVVAAFLCHPKLPPVFGTYVRRLTTEEQQRSKSVDGAIVLVVVKRSPAAGAGVLPGDVILRIGSESIVDDEAYFRAVEANQGRSVEVEWSRNGERLKQRVQFNPG